MSVKRIENINGLPVVGKYYLVQCVQHQGTWIPVSPARAVQSIPIDMRFIRPDYRGPASFDIRSATTLQKKRCLMQEFSAGKAVAS